MKKEFMGVIMTGAFVVGFVCLNFAYTNYINKVDNDEGTVVQLKLNTPLRG